MAAIFLPEEKLSLKLMLNKKTQKLIYAEASKEFVDFLFGPMKLPLGTVSRLLTSDKMVGSFGNLYVSVENLRKKQSLLEPTLISNDHIPLLPTDIFSTTTRLFRCPNSPSEWYSTGPCKYHGLSAATELVHRTWNLADTKGGGYVIGVVTCMITDHLTVEPATPSSVFKILTKAGVLELGSLEERTVEVGMDEGLKLLKEAMVSRKVLTNVFPRKSSSATGVKQEA